MSAPLPALTGDHRLGNDAPTVENPVRIAHAITTLLYLAVGLGWFAVPSATVDAIGTVGAFLLSTAAAEWARARVSPTGRITLDTVRGYIRAEVFAVAERLAASAPSTETIQATVTGAVAAALGTTLDAGRARAGATNGKG